MAQVAVIGLGRFGFHVAKALHLAGHDVLAIDVDAGNVQAIKDFSSRAVVLDARDRQRLEELGIRDFDTVVVSLGERIDASAIITLHLREMGIRRIVTKAGSEDHAKLLELIGAHEVISPEREAAEHLARRLSGHNILDFIPMDDELSIHEIAPPNSFIGKSLEELRLRKRFRVQVLGIRDMLTQELQINPEADLRLRDSDSLLVLGRNQDLERLSKA